MEDILNAVAEHGLITDNTPSVETFDLDYFRGRCAAVNDAFGESFILNAGALKANSIRGVLLAARDGGLGAECASISEAMHAVKLGFKPEDVVYDSPCKTRVELKLALETSIVINLDNECEIEMVDELLNGELKAKVDSGEVVPRVGLRVNPVVGGGAIAIISTATKLSKFGVPIMEETREKVIELYKNNEWLTGIHIHVGSQGVPLEKFVDGARVCYEFVKDLEAGTGRPLKTIDIGGGLSTDYKNEAEPEGFTFARYRQRLNETVPELFSGKYRIITEFGRSLFLKAGRTLTRVDFIKQWVPDVNPIILTHVGTNQFIRETYIPDVWRHRYSLADKSGKVKTGAETQVYDLAGPMCFQGDYLAKNVELPVAEVGDWLIIHETGGYTMAMYSKFNSILPSPIYGFERLADGKMKVSCFKERETIEENMKFWGLETPRVL